MSNNMIMTYSNKPKRTVIKVDCECLGYCGNGFDISFHVEDEDAYCFISTYASGFVSNQDGLFKRFLSRLKSAWLILMGKEYCLHDICLTKKSYNDFVNKLNEFTKENNTNV